MGQHGTVGQAGRRILQLAPDFEPGGLTLSSVEFFLLSRIDGSTPWRVLREMSGMTAEESDLCLEGWLAAGYVQLAHLETNVIQEKLAEAPRAEAARGSRWPDVDPGLDLDVATQRRIAEFEELLGGPDHLLLGVDEKADEKSVKRAYFKRSREFHPDRYFRREMGPYRNRLERIFKEIQRAYEAHLRRVMEDGSQPAHDPPLRKSAQAPPLETSGRFSSPDSVRLDRLSRRLTGPLPDHVRHERQQKARQLLAGAEQAVAEGRLQEALTCLEIVMRFDPHNVSARRALGEVRSKLGDTDHASSGGQAKFQPSESSSVSIGEGVPGDSDGNRGRAAR